MTRWRSLTGAIALALLAPGAPKALAAGELPELSVFEPAAHGKTWMRLGPNGPERPLVRLVGEGQPVVAWNASATEAIAWLSDSDPAARGAAPTGMRVSLESGKSVPVTLPAVGRLGRVAFDRRGGLVALVVLQQSAKGLQEGKDAHGSFLRYEGKLWRVPAGREGIPALARAYRLERSRWLPVETVLTSTDWDYAQDVDALEAAKGLLPTDQQLREEAGGFSPVADRARVKQVRALAPTEVSAEGELAALTTAAGPVWVWRESGEFIFSTRLVAWGDAAHPVRLPGVARPKQPHELYQAATIHARGHFLLVSDPDGSYPRLYDVARHQLLYSSQAASGATFWPR